MIAKTITSLGTPVTITLATGGNLKTNAIFSGELKTSETSDVLSFTSPITVGSAICYIAANTKVPAVGDELTGNNRSYSIKEVQAYRPAAVVIAYKITLE